MPPRRFVYKPDDESMLERVDPKLMEPDGRAVMSPLWRDIARIIAKINDDLTEEDVANRLLAQSSPRTKFTSGTVAPRPQIAGGSQVPRPGATSGRADKPATRAIAPRAGEDRGGPILQRVQELVAANAALRSTNAEQRAEIDQLKTLLGQIERSLRLTPASTAPRRARSPKRAVAATKRRKRQRAVITDPVVLEKRRAALEKARVALAAKRAAAKAS